MPLTQLTEAIQLFSVCLSNFRSILLEQARKISLRIHVLQKCKDGYRIDDPEVSQNLLYAPNGLQLGFRKDY